MRLETNNLHERIKGTLIETLGIKFEESDDQTSLVGYMLVTSAHSQTMGVLHGGATVTLAESVSGVASNALCNSDEVCFGMQLSVSHISSAQIGDTVKAVAKLEHKGRTSHVWNVEVRSETTHKLISAIRVTNSVVKVANRNDLHLK